MEAAVRTAIEAALGAAIIRSASVSGGDTAEAFRIELDDGRTVFAKTHRNPPAHFFTTEAAGLRTLTEPAVVAVPQVIAANDGPIAFLVLSWIEAAGRGRADEPAFGRQLAELHRTGVPTFGRVDRRTTGSLGLPNEPTDNWAEFYAANRLLPLARLATDRSALSTSAIARLEHVATHLPELGGPVESPARLHGDLWAGNRLVDASGRSWLIDPAAHGGHREFDLAMMRLFGGFGGDAFGAYDDEFPLAAGWAERVELHQIAPLVVHAIKFGGAYRSAATAAIDRYR